MVNFKGHALARVLSTVAALILLTVGSSVAIAAPKPPQGRAAIPVPGTPPPADLNLADYIFGPPPHNHIDPGIRCWMHCPKPPAKLPPSR
jgi:hypothetical protein